MATKEVLAQEVEPGVTVQDLINAVQDLLDGVMEHDIHNMTGLPQETIDRISGIKAATAKYWQING